MSDNATISNISPETFGHIHSTESFGAADGPGVRFIKSSSGVVICDVRIVTTPTHGKSAAAKKLRQAL